MTAAPSGDGAGQASLGDRSGQAPFADRVRRGERVVGTFVKLAATEVVDLVAKAGFDFCVVDAEHSQAGEAEAARLVRHAAAIGFPALVRLPAVDAGVANRMLEAGAAGIQVSTIRSAAQACALRDAMRYPPQGVRSVSLAQPAAGYGSVGVANYLAWMAEHAPLVVGQIETASTEEPLADVVDPLDVAFVGTTDLSVDLGVPGETGHPTVVDRIAEIAVAARDRGVAFGGWVGGTGAGAAGDSGGSTLLAHGATYLLVGSDLQSLATGLSAAAGMSLAGPPAAAALSATAKDGGGS